MLFLGNICIWKTAEEPINQTFIKHEGLIRIINIYKCSGIYCKEKEYLGEL